MTVSVIAENLVKKFGDFYAVKGISFQVKEGEIFGFLGPNGAGKTTTIKMLCGLLRPTDGNGNIAGYDIKNEQPAIKEIVGYMSQKFSLYSDLTVYENLAFFGGIYGIKNEKLEKRLSELSSMIKLEPIRNVLTGDLSLGWKQRLALASAILHKPEVLFLDEPTSGVAPDARRRFWNLIYRLSSEGVTVFVTTHYMDEAEHCDRLAFISNGEIIASGTAEEIKKLTGGRIILEVKCNPLIDGLKLIEKNIQIKEAAPFGDSLHITVDDEKSTAKNIKKLLKENDIILKSINRIAPSLEDIFVKLIKDQDAN